MAGHIKLGKFSDVTLRDYALYEIDSYQAATANPFAARVSTGGPYSELDMFNDWTIQDWHMGVGNTEPEQGQLFSIAETRFPGYLMPPPGWDYPLTQHNLAQAGLSNANPFTLLAAKMYSVSFTATKNADIDGVWVLVHVPPQKNSTVQLWSDDGSGKPDVSLKTASAFSNQERVHAHWMQYKFASPQTLVAGTRYHISIKTTLAAALGSGISPYLPTVAMSGSEKCCSSTDGGTTWALETGGIIGFHYLISYSADNTDLAKGVYVASDGDVFLWIDNAIYSVSAGDIVSEVSGITIYDVVQLGDELYVAYGTGYKIYNMSTDVTTDKVLADTYRFLFHGGYLWRSTGTTVAYTADESSWTTIQEVYGLTGNAINGMAGLERELYFATADGLYVAVAGDVILQVAPWPARHPDNGKGMVSWEGALYVPLAGGAIMRYDPSGAMINVGINAKEELPLGMAGTVSHLRPTNYFLMAVVDYGGFSSLWAYNVDGWHCLSLAPQGVRGGAIAFDYTNQYMYWGMGRALLMRTTAPSNTNNPAQSLSSLKLAPEGWVEYDRFYAGHVSLKKDFDRVFIDTRIWGQCVHVYWQDDDNYRDYFVNHNGEMGWQYLGTLSTFQVYSIQFPAAGRPGGRSFRLALRIVDKDTVNGGPPVVRGVSVKYSTNVTDRERWVLPIAIGDNQQMPDGTINPFTAAQQIAHLRTLIAETAPLKFTDLDGVTHVVTVTGNARNPVRYDWLAGTNAPKVEWVFTLTIEETSVV